MSLSDFIPVLNFQRTATVASSQTSGAVDLGGSVLAGIRTPVGLVSTSVSFQSAERSTGTYSALMTSTGGSLAITVSTEAQQMALNPADFAGVQHLKVVTGSTEADKTFTLATRPWGL